MRLLAIVHQEDAGPGVFGDAVAAAGERLEVWRPAEREPVPTAPGEYDAIMTFGGGMHPDQETAHPWLAAEKRLLRKALEQRVPVLAVCLGAELLAEAAGGSSRRAARPEIGWSSVRRAEAGARDPVLGAMPSRFDGLEWHSYEFLLPPGGVALASSQTCLQAYRVGDSAWGIQFHAEVTLPTFESWLDDYHADPDALAVGLQPEALRLQTRAEIGEWNRMGRTLCARFLDIAGRASGGVPRTGTG